MKINKIAPLAVIPLVLTIGLSGCSVATAKTAEDQEVVAKVVEVVSGDELKVALDNGDHQIVRLLGIDAQGMHDGVCGADTARDETRRIVEKFDQVRVIDDGAQRLDDKGRTVAYVLVDGDDLGEQLLEKGMVRVHLPQEGEKISKAKKYEKMMQKARDKEVGLWGQRDADGKACLTVERPENSEVEDPSL